MAYTYSDYITLTDTAAREVRLRLFVKEITDLISADVGKGPNSRSSGGLPILLAELKDELKELVIVNRQRTGSRIGLANMNGAAP